MAKSLEQQNKELAKSKYNVSGNKQNIIPNQRMGFDVGTLFDVNLNPEGMPGYPAYVNPNDPNNIFFRPALSNALGTVPEALAHESEHILEQRAVQRYGGENPVQYFFFKNLKDTTGDREVSWAGRNKASKLYRNFFDAANKNEKVANRLYELGLSPNVMYIGKNLKSSSLREILASLSGFESAYNIDLTQDPLLKKELFQDSDELIKTYKAVTGLRQERLDAKDLEPYKADLPPVKKKGMVEKIIDVFSNPLMEDSTK
jgi:hypothetical protein